MNEIHDAEFLQVVGRLEDELASESAALSDEFKLLDEGLNKSFAEADQAFDAFMKEMAEGEDE